MLLGRGWTRYGRGRLELLNRRTGWMEGGRNESPVSSAETRTIALDHREEGQEAIAQLDPRRDQQVIFV